MKPVALPDNETARLKALLDYNLLDTPPEEVYDDITQIASEICRTPIALISLIDADRQWYKSKLGISVDEDPRAYSFCAHAILKPDEIFIVPDARRDERFSENPLTIGAPNIVFYAGVPLTDSEGYSLGSLCVVDKRLRTLTENQLLSLKALARLVVTHFELRKIKAERDRYHNDLKQVVSNQEKALDWLTHQVKPLIEGIKISIQALANGKPRSDQVTHIHAIKETNNLIKDTLNDPKLLKS
jgi:GAF domain-containing protein